MGEHKLASQADFDDSNWEAIQIPHYWSIEGGIDKNNPSGSQGGFYPGGVGYYRKTFHFENNWKDKLVLVTFDGVMSNSEVWINGQHLGKRPNGYVGFTYDLTHYLKKGTIYLQFVLIIYYASKYRDQLKILVLIMAIHWIWHPQK